MKALFLVCITILTCSGCFFKNIDEKKDFSNQFDKLHLLWEYRYDNDGGAPRAKPIITKAGNIITSGDSKITSIDKNGALNWKTEYHLDGPLANRFFGMSDNIVVGSKINDLIAWNILNGEELWRMQTQEPVRLNDFEGISTNGDYFYAVGLFDELFVINTNGNVTIHHLENLRSYESAVNGDYLYLSQRNREPDKDYGVSSCIKLSTMEQVWRIDLEGFGFSYRMQPLIVDGIVYFGTTGGPSGSKNAFFALDAATGREIWRQDRVLTYNAVLEGDYIYVNNGGGVVKLRKADGRIIWETDFKSSGAAPIDYGYGYVYAPHNGRMKILDAETGEIVHQLDPPHGSFFWLVTAEAGRIFAQSNRHLYAFAPWGHTEPLED